MKKISVTILSFLLAILFALPAFAGNADLDRADASDMEAFTQSVANGRHVFDTLGILSSKETAELEEDLREIEQESGQSAVIVIVENNAISEDLEKYADYLYYHGSLGKGDERDGVLLVLDLGDEAHRGVYIYAQSGAMRYFTDKAIEQILYDYDGGMLELLQDGRWYAALDRYTDAAETLYKQGVKQDQYNYDPETGEKDYYYEKQRSVKLWHVIVSLIVAFLAGFIPMQAIRSRYAMKAEKRQAQRLNVAYRSNAVYAFAVANDALIGEHTTHIPIPHQDNNNHTGGSSFGGGGSTMHSSMGGGHHSGGGAKF